MSTEVSTRKRGTGCVYKRPGSKLLWLKYSVGGAVVYASAKTSDRAKAEKLLKWRLAQAELKQHPALTELAFEDLIALLYSDYEIHERRSLRRDAAGRRKPLDRITRLEKFFAGYTASEIDEDALAKFTLHQKKQGYSNASINRSMAALKHAFRLALRIKQNRGLIMPYFVMLPEAPPRQGFVEQADYEKLMVVLPDYIQPVVAVGYLCGMRLQEVLGLTWDRIDLFDNLIRLDRTKNDETRYAPIVPPLRELLVRQREHWNQRGQGLPFVFFRVTRKGHAVRLRSFYKAWHSACVRAGLGSWDTTKGKREYVGLLFHDLRRSGVRNLRKAGVDQKTRMLISGHKTDSVDRRYNIISEADIHDAGEKLARFHEREAQRVRENGDIYGDSKKLHTVN